MEIVSVEMVFRAMGPDEITWKVNMGFMKHFDIKNGSLYQQLEATVSDIHSYAFRVQQGL